MRDDGKAIGFRSAIGAPASQWVKIKGALRGMA